MTTAAVELTGLTVTFGGVRALADLDLRVPRGARLGVIGPAASGKSVLLRALGGLVPVAAGSIVVLGERLAQRREPELADVRRRIGMLFQNPALFDFLTVAGNIAFPLEQRGEPAEVVARAVAERLAAVGLVGSEAKSPAQLSGGMKKRVGIARASIARPELLLYDEPTAGLDPVTSRKIFDLLEQDQRATNATVIVASSDVDAVLDFATQIAFLDEGRLRHLGPTSELASATDPGLASFLSDTLARRAVAEAR